jgi:hypothetical protein
MWKNCPEVVIHCWRRLSESCIEIGAGVAHLARSRADFAGMFGGMLSVRPSAFSWFASGYIPGIVGDEQALATVHGRLASNRVQCKYGYLPKSGRMF